MLISNTSRTDFELERSAVPGARASGTLFSLVLILAVLAANAGTPDLTSTPDFTSAPGFTSTTRDVAESIVPVTPASSYNPFRFGN